MTPQALSVTQRDMVDAPTAPMAVAGKPAQLDNTDGNHGIVRILTPEQVSDLKKPELKPTDPVDAPMSALAGDTLRKWERAKTAKIDIERVMIECLRQREGEYTPQQMQDIKETGQAEIFCRITAIKCGHAEAWLNEILNQIGDKPWGLDPSPLPDLPPVYINAVRQQAVADLFRMMAETGMPLTPQDMQTAVMLHANRLRHAVKEKLDLLAKEKAKNMEDLIEDQFGDNGMDRLLKDFIQDLVTFPAGFLLGPVVTRKKKLTWSTAGGSNPTPITEWIAGLTYKRVSPFDVFPLPETTTTQDGGFFIRQRVTPDKLDELRELPWINTEELNNLILDKQRGAPLHEWTQIDNERAILEGKRTSQDLFANTIDILQCYDMILGKDLISWGIKKKVDEKKWYDCVVWLIGRRVIGVQLNWHPLDARPLSKCSFEEVPGSFWGHGVPQKIKDVQAIANGSMRAIINNMGMASGPQVAITDINRLAYPEQAQKLRPWKIWAFTNPEQSQAKPIEFFMPEAKVAELIAVYDRAIRDADEVSGIPAYAYGNDRVAGAGKTLGGLNMLMNAAARGIRLVIFNVDTAFKEMVSRQYVHNMLFSENHEVKGDCSIVSRGALSLLVKEQTAQRRQEFLMSTNNPIDYAIMGPKRRANLLRTVADTLDMDSEKVVPSEEELDAQLRVAATAAEQTQQTPGPQGQPAEPQAAPKSGQRFTSKQANAQIQRGRAP